MGTASRASLIRAVSSFPRNRPPGQGGFFDLLHLHELAARRGGAASCPCHYLPYLHLRGTRHRAVGRHRRDLHGGRAQRGAACHVLPAELPEGEAPCGGWDGDVVRYRVVRRARVDAVGAGVQAHRKRAGVRLRAGSQGCLDQDVVMVYAQCCHVRPLVMCPMQTSLTPKSRAIALSVAPLDRRDRICLTSFSVNLDAPDMFPLQTRWGKR